MSNGRCALNTRGDSRNDDQDSCFLKVATEVATNILQSACKYWSGRRDLNSGPLAPHASARSAVCATLPNSCRDSRGLFSRHSTLTSVLCKSKVRQSTEAARLYLICTWRYHLFSTRG